MSVSTLFCTCNLRKIGFDTFRPPRETTIFRFQFDSHFNSRAHVAALGSRGGSPSIVVLSVDGESLRIDQASHDYESIYVTLRFTNLFASS